MRFGSVGGGGRYDGLVSRFRGEPVPATGFSIGVSRLQAALKLLGKLDTETAARPGGRHGVRSATASPTTSAWSRELRNAGIRAEMYLGNPKNFGKQMKYADKRNAPASIIQGGDEKAQQARCRSRT